MTELPGHKPLVVNRVVVGPFEEKEEGTGVPSNVVKVEGEELTTASPLPSGMTGVAVGGSDLNWERNPWAGLEYDAKDLNLKLELFIP